MQQAGRTPPGNWTASQPHSSPWSAPSVFALKICHRHGRSLRRGEGHETVRPPFSPEATLSVRGWVSGWMRHHARMLALGHEDPLRIHDDPMAVIGQARLSDGDLLMRNPGAGLHRIGVESVDGTRHRESTGRQDWKGSGHEALQAISQPTACVADQGGHRAGPTTQGVGNAAHPDGPHAGTGSSSRGCCLA
ncbi:hypothetical protein CDEF62S_02218 [Castellaniella defragrans]